MLLEIITIEYFIEILKDKMKDISIVTVTMNHLHQVKDLLQSIYKEDNTSLKVEVIIVDNCSSDGTFEFIKENYPDVKLIRNSKPYGFAKNNNIGVKHATGEYIGIINPDIILLPNSLDVLVKRLKEQQNVAMVCPRLLNTDGTIQFSIRKFVTPKILLGRLLTFGKDNASSKKVKEYLMSDANLSEEQSIDWAIGAAYVISKKKYIELKGFDENFFLYVEDVDLCKRIHDLEYDIKYIPESKMIHAHNRSSRGITKATYRHFKSMFYYFRKHKLWFN